MMSFGLFFFFFLSDLNCIGKNCDAAYWGDCLSPLFLQNHSEILYLFFSTRFKP